MEHTPKKRILRTPHACAQVAITAEAAGWCFVATALSGGDVPVSCEGRNHVSGWWTCIPTEF